MKRLVCRPVRQLCFPPLFVVSMIDNDSCPVPSAIPVATLPVTAHRDRLSDVMNG